MSEETLEMLWDMLTDEQLIKLKDSGEFDIQTKQSLYAALLTRCLVEVDEAAEYFI